MSIGQLLREKRSQILRIAEEHGARNVRVFGSVARGEADSVSDVDLLVSLEPDTTILKHVALIRELEAVLGRSVHVVSDRALRPRFRDQVLREAVPV